MELPAPFGKYHLLERLAVGGMAEVFLAKAFGAAGFERILVIKKILPHMSEDEEFITMFIDEARIASTLNHSNIIQITELGREDKDYYIAMEYTMGKDLSRVHQKLGQQKRTMPIPLAVLVASRICEGLEYAHRKKDSSGKSLNIIHRDVSPGNVLISYDGDVKIIDFGIAKAQNRMGRTTAGTLKGKFGYMSPEQVRGHGLDHRSDIFSVGILLYEMLTGERLFGAESDFGTLEKVRNAQVVPPTTYNSKIPAELEQVVMQSLAREPEERYEWASDMQEDLVRFLMNEGSLTTSKSLASFMRDLFRKELEKENEKMSVFRKRGYPWVDAAKGEDPQEALRTIEMPAVAGPADEEEEEIVPPDLSDELDEDYAAGESTPQDEAFQVGTGAEPSFAEASEGAPSGASVEAKPSRHDEKFGAVSAPVVEGADAVSDEQLSAPTQIFEASDLPTEEEAAPAVDPDQQLHQPTMILPDGIPEEPPTADKPLPREPSRPGRSRAKNRSMQKRPPRKRKEASTGTEALAGRGGRPGPLTTPEKAPAKKKSAPWALLAVFAGGLAVAAVLGYFLFVPSGNAPLPEETGPGAATPVKAPPVEGPDAVPAKDPEQAPAADPDEAPAADPDGAGLGLDLAAKDAQADGVDAPKGDAAADQAAKDQAAKDQAAKDQAAKDQAAKDQAAKDQAAREQAARELADRERAAEEQAAKEKAAREKAAKELAAKERAADEKAARELAAREKAAQEKAAREKAAQEKPALVQPKPKHKKKKRRVARASGAFLKVVSTPSGADILLNGKVSGKTPRTFRGLDAGKNYFVVLRKPGYKKFFEGVKFDDKKKAEVKAALVATGAKAAAKPAPAASGTGFLVANTTPWAKVIIDGKDSGKWTPVVGKNKISLSAGKHVVTFRTKEGKTITVKVTIEAGKTAKVIKKID